MASRNKVIIAGYGYVGEVMANLWNELGYSVLGLRRTARDQNVTESIATMAVDLTALDSLPHFESCAFVVYCAAASKHNEAAYRQTYVDGLENVIRRVKDLPKPWPRLVFTSSTGVYGQNDGSIVTEQSETVPETFSGKIMLEAEDRLLKSGLDAVILRLSGIYGPGRDRIVRQLKEGVPMLSTPLHDEYLNRIHRVDAARAAVHVCVKGCPAGVYICSDREPALKSQVWQHVHDELTKLGHSLAPLPTFSTENPQNKRCISKKLQDTGFLFRFSTYREGLAELLK